MTVCVAAIANNGMIIGASDRMLSNIEIAYEPDSQKVHTVTSAISALWAGDPAILSEILGALQYDVQAILAQDPPPDWFRVREIVDLYVAHWGAARRARATAAILSPLGLTMESFIAQQAVLATGVAEKLTSSLMTYSLPTTNCIIAGIDHSGAHIWSVTDGVPSCHDAIGFATIGAGARHADSQMTTGKHTPAKSPSETLVLVHMAKKRAEVSPSVGAATDIVLIGPTLGQHGNLPQYHLDQLDRDFAELRQAEALAFAAAVTQFDAYLAALNAEQPAGAQEPESEPLRIAPEIVAAALRAEDA